MTERHPDADHRAGVVPREGREHGVPLRGPRRRALRCGGHELACADRRPGDECPCHPLEQSPLPVGAQLLGDGLGGRQPLTGLQQQDRAVELLRTREAVGERELGEHLHAAAPGRRRYRLRGPGPGPPLGGFAVAVLVKRGRMLPRPPEVLGLPRFGDLEGAAIEQRRPERSRVDVVDDRPRAEMHLRGSAVETRDAVPPQPVQDVRVVAVAEERLRIRLRELRIEMRGDQDLVVAADGREDRPDRRVGEGLVHVGGARFGTRAELPRRRVLDRHESGERGQPAHRLLVDRGRDRGRREGRREHRDTVAGTGLGRMQHASHPRSSKQEVARTESRGDRMPGTTQPFRP